MRITQCIGRAIVLAAVAGVAAVHADEPTEADLIGRFDLAVPDVPAANVLGLSPDTVIRPSTGRDFAAGLLNGVGTDGKLQAGIALDARPALFLAQENFTLSKYRDEKVVLDSGTTFERYKMKREAYWTKLRLSFATGRAEAQSGEADRYAVGASWNLFDHGDSRLSPAYRNCVKPVLTNIDAQAAKLEEQGDEVGAAKLKASLETTGAKQIRACAKDFEASHWNADSWDVGTAYFDFNTPQVKSDGYAAWTTYARHMGTRGQLILHARFQDDEVAQDPKDKTAFVIQDALILGARVRWKAPGGAFLLEATRRDIARQTDDDEKYTLASVGYEMRIADGFWVQLATGKAYGTDAFENDAIFSGQLRWGRTEKSILGN